MFGHLDQWAPSVADILRSVVAIKVTNRSAGGGGVLALRNQSGTRGRDPLSGPGKLALAVAAATLALGAACSSGDDESGSSGDETTSSTSRATPTPTATQPTSTTPTTAYSSVEEEIAARYEAFWQARFEANSPPDPEDPDLREYAVGQQLDQVLQETQAHRAAGTELRRREDRSGIQRIEVVEVTGDTAVVQECFVDDGLVVRSSDGSVVDDAVWTYNVRGEMQRVDGRWRLAKATLVQQWEGVAGCALSP